MSVETVPKSLKTLRACLVCSLVKTFDQFEADGCDNCESVLHLKRNRYVDSAPWKSPKSVPLDLQQAEVRG